MWHLMAADCKPSVRSEIKASPCRQARFVQTYKEHDPNVKDKPVHI